MPTMSDDRRRRIVFRQRKLEALEKRLAKAAKRERNTSASTATAKKVR